MKQLKKGLLSMVLCLSLVISLMCDNVGLKAATIVDENNITQTEVTPYLLTDGSKEDLDKYNINCIQTTTENEMVPITVTTKGYLYYVVATNMNSGIYVYEDINATVKLGKYVYVSNSSTQIQEGVYAEEGDAYFSKAGTYYIQFEKPGTYVISSQLVNGANRTLKDNTYTTAYGYSYDTYNYDSKEIYYKYKATKTGYITVTCDFLEEYGLGYVTLCNSKKKALSEEVSSSNGYGYKSVFAVKKDTTYYIKVRSTAGAYRVKAKVTGVSESSGAKKAKAKALTLGKEKKGIILSEDKTSSSDWYKFTLTKATKIKLTVKGNVSSESLQVELTSANISGSLTRRISEVDYNTSTSVETYTSSTLPKGTYYIRVYKENKLASGNYSIKVSKR